MCLVKPILLKIFVPYITILTLSKSGELLFQYVHLEVGYYYELLSIQVSYHGFQPADVYGAIVEWSKALHINCMLLFLDQKTVLSKGYTATYLSHYSIGNEVISAWDILCLFLAQLFMSFPSSWYLQWHISRYMLLLLSFPEVVLG